jgi:hypothetical protein
LTCQDGPLGDRNVNPACKRYEINVKRADNDPLVVGVREMQLNEVPAVEREQSAALRSSESQDLSVRNGLARLPGLLRRQDVVSQLPQLFHSLQGEVLVSIQAGHL